MNKILSILALCAIINLAAAWSNPPVSIADKQDNTIPYLARCKKDDQVVRLTFSPPANISDTTLNYTITRRYLNNSFAKADDKAADESFSLRLNLSDNDIKNGQLYTYGWSHDGYVAIGSTVNQNVSVYIFRSDSDLKDPKSIVQSKTFATAPTGTRYKITSITYREGYFYVAYILQSSDSKTNNAFLTAVKAADASIKGNGNIQVNADGSVQQIKCAQTAGTDSTSFCVWGDSTNVKARNVSTKDGTAPNSAYIVNTGVNLNGAVVAANKFYAALSADQVKPGSIDVRFDNVTDNATAQYTIDGATTIVSEILAGNQYFDNMFIALYNTANTNGSSNINSIILSRNDKTVALNASTPNLGSGSFLYDFTLRNQSYYAVFQNADGSVSIGQVSAKTAEKDFGSALQCAFASIFVAVALLFAF